MMDHRTNGSPKPDAGNAGCELPEVAGYTILERIGKGGMGEVFLARQLTLGRLVAIKFLVPEDEPEAEDHLPRFRREAELMAKVSHPNILSIHDFGEVDGLPYLVMEYAEGGDLRRRLTAGRPMTTAKVRLILLPVGEALAYLHRIGIIHRDLKPENILLHHDDNPCVSDFGIAVLRAGSRSLTQTGRGVGTLGYIAPEQQYRLKVDERADQYSLAAVAYEMLTGQLPLGVFKAPSELNPRLGPEVDAVILRALQENPGDRFATIREFTHALGLALDVAPSRLDRPTIRPLAWAGVGLLAVVGVLAFLLTRSTPVPSPTPRPPLVGPGPTALPADPSTSRVKPSPPSAVAFEKAAGPLSIEEELKWLRALQIWKARGSPVGEAGEAVKDEIWVEASKSVVETLQKIAYQVWMERGSPMGEAGEAVKDENWAEAQRRLLKELSAENPPRSEPPQEPSTAPKSPSSPRGSPTK